MGRLFVAGSRVIVPLTLLSVLAVGSPVPAPSGFLDLCRRSPSDCVTEAQSPDDLVDVSTQATRIFWKRVFDETGREVAVSAEDAAQAAPALAALPHPGVDALSAADVTAPVAAGTPDLIPTLLKKAAAVNRRINRSMRPRPDSAAFGQPDYWHGDGVIGDCEDFALAKRRALIAEGMPPALLSIALVTTPRGEDHAVLLVADGDDAIVLDNLTPWIVRPSQTAYRWVSRQRFGDPLEWVRLDR